MNRKGLGSFDPCKNTDTAARAAKQLRRLGAVNVTVNRPLSASTTVMTAGTDSVGRAGPAPRPGPGLVPPLPAPALPDEGDVPNMLGSSSSSGYHGVWPKTRSVTASHSRGLDRTTVVDREFANMATAGGVPPSWVHSVPEMDTSSPGSASSAAPSSSHSMFRAVAEADPEVSMGVVDALGLPASRVEEVRGSLVDGACAGAGAGEQSS